MFRYIYLLYMSKLNLLIVKADLHIPWSTSSFGAGDVPYVTCHPHRRIAKEQVLMYPVDSIGKIR